MLLDTNAISAWAEGESGFFAAMRHDRPWYLASIALGEYRFGLLASTKRDQLEPWVDGIENACAVLLPDAMTARRYAALRNTMKVSHPQIPYHDLWIAALAEQHGLAFVSQDKHFDSMPGIRRIGWRV